MADEKKNEAANEIQDKFNTEDIHALVEDGEIEHVHDANDKAGK